MARLVRHPRPMHPARVPVTPPKLPRSRRLRAAIKAEAETNTRVRAALDAAKAGKASRHRRVFADAELRIY